MGIGVGLKPSVTCKRTWGSSGGHRRDFMVGCPLAVAAVSSCEVLEDRWVAPHLAVRTLFDCCRWTCSVTQVVQRTSLWPASWLPAVHKGRSSKSVDVQRVWEVYDERLQFMSRQDALLLDASLASGDVSQAWSVWSGAVESALADAYRFSGGPLPSKGLVLGRGCASFRVVKLGGHKVRKARGYAVDGHDVVDVFLHRDSSIAPLLDLRRRLKAVMELVDAMIRYGVSLSRSVELSAQWERILDIGPLFPVTLIDFQALRGAGLGDFYHVFVAFVVVFVILFILSLFIGGMRPLGVGVIGFVKIHLFTRISGSGLIWFSLPLFFSVSRIFLLVALGFYLIPLGLMRNSERLGFPTFVALGKGRPALRNSIVKLRGGYLCYRRFLCLV